MKDSNGAPVAGVTVQAVSPAQTANATTDAGGHFDLLNLAPDTYTINLTKEGYTPVALPGNIVFADQTIQVNVTMQKSLKQIARVTATAASSLVKAGVGGDLYSVSGSQIQASSSANGGGNLNSAYSAISTVPGIYVGSFGMGWNQATVVRGENPFFTGFEYDGIPVNRAFDNYNSSTESNLGLQQLEVYTGGGPSSIASNGTSGFINQVIKTGTYPGYASLSGGIGTGAFYHQAKVEAGGATPDRNFSYYVGISGYNQTFNYFNNQNGVPFTNPGGVFGIYSELFSPTSSGQADIPVCGPNVAGPGGTGFPYGAPGCYGVYNGLANLAQQITDRENVVNLHLGIPRQNGQRDDVQLLWSASALREVFDNNPSTGTGINLATQANSGLPYLPGLNYPHYNDAIAYNTAFGTPIASSPTSVSTPGLYYEPSTPTNRAFNAQLPTNYFGDVNNNDTGIVKLQYTHPFNDRSFLRVFGYTFFSDWTENGQMAGYSGFFTAAPVVPNYNLITHTSGAEIQYSNQLNDQNLVTFTGNWTSANVARLNNEYWESGLPISGLISPGGPACGGALGYTLDQSALASANATGSATYPCLDGFGTSPIGYMKIGAPGAHQFTCYTSAGHATPCLPGGSWESNAFLGPNCAEGATTSGLPTINCAPYTPVAGASWVSLWNGNNNGPLNEVRPEFGNLSLSDEFRPNDKWLIDASLKYDNFNYGLADSTSLADQFAAYQVANYSCVNARSGQVLVSPLLPGEIPPPDPILTSGDCDAAYKANYTSGTQTTGWVHPNGTTQDGVASRAFSNNSPPGYDQYYYSPRLAVTYTSDPDNVFRFSGGRYTEPPISASVQYLYSSGAGATGLWTNFLGDGYYSPFHPIPGMTSAQYDASWEHRVKNTDWSFKLSPFFTQTSNWEQQAFIGSGFVTQVPVGRFQSEG
ncbi:MAG TPA: TonB-dependent receptor, partial [Candidatus Acidoferrales bacterium]|nr:TonB-dependent receptor [Candidatus Acidoferrales bacterium]